MTTSTACRPPRGTLVGKTGQANRVVRQPTPPAFSPGRSSYTRWRLRRRRSRGHHDFDVAIVIRGRGCRAGRAVGGLAVRRDKVGSFV